MYNRVSIKNFLLKGNPVITLTGNEFAKKEGYTLTQQVTEYYNSIGNTVISPDYGEIILDKQSVEDDFAHGVGRVKAVAFAAVPAVIEKGVVILPLAQHKTDENSKIYSAMIAAPIQIAEKEYICVVVIRQYFSGNRKLYVHEITLKEKLLDIDNQEVISVSLLGSSNPAPLPATNQGDITKVLQNILSAK